MKKSGGTGLAQCGAISVLLLVIWVGSYVWLRHFSESEYIKWHSFSVNGTVFEPEVTKVIDVPKRFLLATAVFKPLVIADEIVTGEKIGFFSIEFNVGATATF